MCKKLVMCISVFFLVFICGFAFNSSFAQYHYFGNNHSLLAEPSHYKVAYRVFGKPYRVLKSSKNYTARGIASWYGRAFHRKRTSSGERFNMYALTAAHKSLPLKTYVQVTNLINGKKVVVKVNDRGPFVGNRLIDLSYAAAQKLGMVGRGLAPVSIKALS